jgi:hypothetical protein
MIEWTCHAASRTKILSRRISLPTHTVEQNDV